MWVCPGLDVQNTLGPKPCSRISRELHDAISQDLFSLNLLAGGLQSALPADSPLQRQAGILEQTTNTTIRELRALLLELRPTRLEQLSLGEALEELATAYSTRLGIHVRTHLTNIPLEAEREQTLLRIAQEALTNAVRHANATEITITLSLEGRMVCFCLCDKGRGFQANTESLRHGLGLRMMQERVQELRGTTWLIARRPPSTRSKNAWFPLTKHWISRQKQNFSTLSPTHIDW